MTHARHPQAHGWKRMMDRHRGARPGVICGGGAHEAAAKDLLYPPPVT